MNYYIRLTVFFPGRPR